MKKFVFIAMILLPVAVMAQQNYCGTEMHPEQLSWLRNFQLNNTGSNERSSELYYVPLKIHVVGTDDGDGYLNVSTIITNMCDLNEQFAPTGFEFYLDGDLDYIANSDYYMHDFYGGSLMMYEHNVFGAVNMYYVDDPAGNCGYFSYGGDAVAVAKSCGNVGNSTIAHELGHFFSLPHTFYGWEWGTPSPGDQEKVDGSNCSSAADGFCDTPPDYAPYRWNCFAVPTFTDPNGETFSPDGTNFMSYADDACMIQFSADQQSAMQANLTGPRSALISGPDPIYVELDSATLISPADNAEDMYVNYTELVWNAIPNAKYYELNLSVTPSFSAIVTSQLLTDTSFLLTDLASEKKYYWRIRPIGEVNYCEPYSGSYNFRTGSQILAGIEQGEPDAQVLTIYPNPANSGNNANVDFVSSISGNASISILDITGKNVYTDQVKILNGLNHFEISLQDIPAGIYMVMCGNADFLSTEKIIIQ